MAMKQNPSPDENSRVDVDLLKLEGEDLLDVELTPEMISKACTVAKLKAWLTEQDVVIPGAATKKSDVVALVLETLKKHQQEHYEKVSKKKKKSKTVLVKRTPVKTANRSAKKSVEPVQSEDDMEVEREVDFPPKSTPSKRLRSKVKVSSSKKVKKSAEESVNAPRPSIPQVSGDLLSKLVKSPSVARQMSPLSPIPPSQPPSDEGGVDSSEELEIVRTPTKDPPENMFQRSSSEKLRKTRSKLLLQPKTSPDIPRTSGSTPSCQRTSARSMPTAPAIRFSNLSTPVNKRSSPRRVVQTVMVPGPSGQPRSHFLISAAIAAFVALAMYLVGTTLMTKPFCDGRKIPDDSTCIPCPIGAVCVRGRAQCRKGKILQNFECVDDPKVMSLFEELYREVIDITARRHGDIICGVRPESDRSVTLEDLEQKLRAMFPDPQFEEAWAKTIHRVRKPTFPLGLVNGTALYSMDSIKPLSCVARHWMAENSVSIGIVFLVLGLIAYFFRRRRVQSRRQKQASEVFKKALLLLRDSTGPFALDHLFEHSFEECGFPKDTAVWDIAVDQLVRDARISNAVTSVNGRQRKGLLFTNTPMKGARKKTIHVYPSASS